MNYTKRLEKENAFYKNAFSSLDNNEKEIESDFIRIAQALEGNVGEDLSGETPQKKVGQDAPELPENKPENSEAEISDEVEKILSADDEQPAEVVEWDNFSIVKSDEYSNKLQQEQGLNVQDADAKSFYIRYKSPEEMLAVQGQIFGRKRDEGEGLVNVGGYNTKEELGKDLEYMKNLWETGFPIKEKDKILVTVDELSPTLEAFQNNKEKEQIMNPKAKEPAQAEEPKEELEVPKEAEKPAPAPAPKTPAPTTPKAPGSKSAPVPKPTPVGKASLNDLQIKRQSRMEILRNIK